MNMQYIQIWKLIIYEFELGHNTIEVTKKIYCVKGESTLYHNTVTRSFKKFQSGCKNLDNQARPDRPKTLVSKAVLQTIETKQVSNTWSVSVSSASDNPVWFVTFMILAETSGAAKSCYITKILQNF